MIELNENFDCYSMNELIGINNSINDSESELNTSKFDNSDLKNSIIKEVENYFSCKKCSNIISNTKFCQKCDSFFCGNCCHNMSICQICKSTKQMKQDKDIDLIVNEIFWKGKVIEENLNFNILTSASIKNLRQENVLKTIIKGKSEETDYTSISRTLSQSLIESFSSISSSYLFSSIDNKYSNTNLLDCIENAGKLMKKNIKENKNEYIDINNLLEEDTNSNKFICGILAKYLINEGIVVGVSKNMSTSLQDSIMNWLVTGLYKCRIIHIHFDFHEKVNNDILLNKKFKENFIKSWILIISEELKISQDKLFFKEMYKGSLHLSYITDESFVEENLKEIKKKRKGIKNVYSKLLLQGCEISPEMFDIRYNNNDNGWAKKGEKRGGRDYDPPIGWIGYGLKVINKYDKQDNTWLGMSNIKGEWWVAYHGAGRNKNTEEIKKIILSIVNNGFKIGSGQVHQKYKNVNNLSNNQYPEVGLGLYLSDKISVAEGYSGIIDNKGTRYKIAFMCRVCPNKVRISSDRKDYFVVDPDTNCVRPYRILIKKLNKKI